MSNTLIKRYVVEVVTITTESLRWEIVVYFPPQGISPTKEEAVCGLRLCGQLSRVSLNSELLQGTDLMNSLVGVLTLFRQEPVAMIADSKAIYIKSASLRTTMT